MPLTDSSTLVDRLRSAALPGTRRRALDDEAADEIERLRAAIRQSLDENGDLADGDVCALKALKDALRESGVPWNGDGADETRNL